MKTLLFILGFSLVVVRSFADDDKETTSSKIKGMFVFGSSLVDNGNNNFLQNLAKADYLPYGVDFPFGPSGRFTNGRNVVDLLGQHLNLPSFLPVFTNPSTKGSVILNGVNFASGGSGILDDTGSIAGKVMSLSEQIRNFEEVTLPEFDDQVRSSSGESSILENYLFVVGTGGNDYSFNYFMKKQQNISISLEAFTTNLTASLSAQLKKLYNIGARKFVIMSLNPLGCSPSVLAAELPRCVPELNMAARLFNCNLKSLVDSVRPEMGDGKIVFVNQYKILMGIIKHPLSKGFKEKSKPCCEVKSRKEGGTGVLCEKNGNMCLERTSHVFFDGLHPTEAVNVEIANKAFASNLTSEVYPFNVQQLSNL
ncbi:hypothetical protein ACFE04_006360 [Oxalis oulophora]